MRGILVGLSAAIALPVWSGPQMQQEAIPFVGCPANVQGSPVEAPSGTPRNVALDHPTAGRIAYYQGEQAPAVYAPRGWHCGVGAGSMLGLLQVRPDSFDVNGHTNSPTHGDAVEIVSYSGETSGRFPVAEYASRLFPRAAAEFIERVKREGLEPASEFERGPFKADSVKQTNGLTAEFTTLPHRTGLGTDDILVPSTDPVRGIVVLDTTDEEWSLTILRVRLGPTMHDVENAILRLNMKCMQRASSC